MTNCLITYGYTKGCRDNIGGIKKLYLANLSNIDSASPVLCAVGTPIDEGTVDSITMVASKYFWEIELTKDNGNFEVTVNINPETGNVTYVPTMNFTLPKMDVNTRNLLNNITREDIVAIAEDNLGNTWILGEEYGLVATTATASSGKAKADLNGWTVALVGEERFEPRYVADDVIDSVLQPEV